MKSICINCDSPNVITRSAKISFPYRVSSTNSVEIQTEIPVRHCVECEFDFTDSDADDARHDAVCRYLGVLNPSEIRKIRKGLSLSRSEFAQITKLGEASLARWETGELIQNGANDNYLRLLCFPENIGRLRMRIDDRFPPELLLGDVRCRFRAVKSIGEVKQHAESFAL